MVNLFLDDLYNNQCIYFSFDFETALTGGEVMGCYMTDPSGYVDEDRDCYNEVTQTWENVLNALIPGMGSRQKPTIYATFEKLETGVLAKAYGMGDDDNIILKVDPISWQKASSVERWYTIYHELGHDVLNFRHGQGGKMMFNYSEVSYTWEDFNRDRNYMFKKYFDNTLRKAVLNQ
tara:strand:+ start:934 stop:1464 length:531 start_codon:yes stop_codon:yes gene_type:complete